jgi:hypothetical protein
MIHENRQLVCTFATQNQLLTTMRSILSSFDIMYNRVYIFESIENRNDVFYTYNIKGVKQGQTFLPNTISIHRKKQSNTFYTINALNNLIQEINNGVLDKEYAVEWDNYRDMAILINDNMLKKVKLRMKEVFHLDRKN